MEVEMALPVDDHGLETGGVLQFYFHDHCSVCVCDIRDTAHPNHPHLQGRALCHTWPQRACAGVGFYPVLPKRGALCEML